MRNVELRVIVSMMALVAVVGCGKGNEEAARAKNQRCREAVADGKVAEARAWLAPEHASHAGFEVSKDEMRELTEAFYTAGAAKVSAAYSEDADAQVSALLVIDLPSTKPGI